MNDDQLQRYSRHILLPKIGVEGQESILCAHVLIVGLGGLGSPVVMYLAAAGIGTMTIVDDDVVDSSNLQRQVIYGLSDVGLKKTASVARSIHEINSAVHIKTYDRRLSRHEIIDLLNDVDVVVDCSDNLSTRLQLNYCCHEMGTPLVSGAAIRFEGQLTVFDFRKPDSPCYQCLYDSNSEESLTCSESGIFSPLVGVIGSMQALETLKLLIGLESGLKSRLALFDGLKIDWRYVNYSKKEGCDVCSMSNA